MAQLGFGLGVSSTAMESGYDQYAQSFGDSMGAMAEETWARNPLSSTADLIGLRAAALKEDSPLIPKEDLNNQYSDLGLSFEEDERQSVVDIIVEEKQAERERQSIMARGPQGIGVSVANFGVGLGISMLDPINLASAFIPVVGQARMAQMVARQGFGRARLIKGIKEGAVGAAVVEPVVVWAASDLQADYGLLDSFLNITFGSILGGGLHVGAGKLKDYSLNKQFKMRQRTARKNLDEAIGEVEASKYRDAEINLYAEYYPEDSAVMRDLEKTSPKTRVALLEKSLNDLLLEKRVDVSPIVDADPILRQSSDTSAKPTNRVSQESTSAEQDTSTAVNNTVNKQDGDFDTEIESLTTRLQEKRESSPTLRFDENEAEIKLATEELDEANAKSAEMDLAVKDAINCMNGR